MVNYMMIGNPGVGKSTLLNGLIGSVQFKSGFKMGSGMTYQLDIKEVDGNKYFDTPGLADVEKRKAAGEAIERALKQDGEYKIFFVIFVQAGRILPQDVATISCVLKACPTIGNRYGLIINKVPSRSVDKIKDNVKGLLAQLSSNGVEQSIFVHVCVKNDELDDVDDVCVPLAEDLRNFIDHCPSINIKPADVAKINTAEYDASVERMERLIEQLMHDKEKMAEAQKEQQERAQAQIEGLMKEHREERENMLRQSRTPPRDNGGPDPLGALLGAIPIAGPLLKGLFRF